MLAQDESKLRADFEAYTLNGWLCQEPGYIGGNPILATSEKLILYKKLGILTDQDREAFVTLIRSAQVQPGVFNRSAFDKSAEAWDDYLALATASYLCNLPFALEIYTYGQAHGWCFDNQNPGIWSRVAFFGRSPSFVAHITACARKPIPLLLQLGWAITIRTSGKSNPRDQDARTLSWLLLQTEPEWASNPLLSGAAASWRKRFAVDWPGGMSAVQAAYLGNPNHPLARYWPPEPA